MQRSRIRRKSTWIDMTPFVDVAFLILTFFIIATKFKPEDVVTIQTPSSVSSEVIKNENDAMIILFDKKGKIYLQVAQNSRKEILKALYFSEVIPMVSRTETQFMKSGIIASPFQNFTAYYSLPENQRNALASGIPSEDKESELAYLIREIHTVKQGKEKWYVKGDNSAKYPAFKNVIKALKENDVYEFNLITSTETIPAGTDLEKTSKK
jgi:biopolymer transport protein ExbD